MVLNIGKYKTVGVKNGVNKEISEFSEEMIQLVSRVLF
jgi:hypothetical protein